MKTDNRQIMTIAKNSADDRQLTANKETRIDMQMTARQGTQQITVGSTSETIHCT
jgi:hypothetical protein